MSYTGILFKQAIYTSDDNSSDDNSGDDSLSKSYRCSSRNQNTFYCDICWDTLSIDQKFNRMCHHHCRKSVCTSCTIAYIQEYASSNNVSLKCIFHKNDDDECSTKIQISDLIDILPQDTINLINDKLFKSLLKNNGNLVWFHCPTPDCENGVFYHDYDEHPFIAWLNDSGCQNTKFNCENCSKTWYPSLLPLALAWIGCVQCKDIYHENVSCTFHGLRKLINFTDNLTIPYFFHQVRSCPNCNAPTQKNGGCNHIICPNCNTDWNWKNGSYRNPHTGKRICWMSLFG